MIRVRNRHTYSGSGWYVGRGTPLGNPWPITRLTTREESIAKYKVWLCEKIEKKDRHVCDELNRIWRAAKVGDVDLICSCVPDDCHANFIKQIIEEKL